MPDKNSLFQDISEKTSAVQGKPAPVVIVTLNSRFSHTGLAARTLEAYLHQHWPESQMNKPGIVRIESTIHEPPLRILRKLALTRAGVFAFSCYIWNIEQIRNLTRDLKKICPDTLIVWGGPEAGSDPDRVMQNNPEVDFVIRGEGEAVFLRLLENLYSSSPDTFKLALPGLSWRHPLTRRLSHEADQPLLGGEQWIFPYSSQDLERDKNKMLYYETSRGCPFRCTYCLSSIDKQLRFKPIDRVFSEIDIFLQHQVRQVKFVDRTFNADINRAKKIWAFLIMRRQALQSGLKQSESGNKHVDRQTNFHFEIAGDLLDEEAVRLLATAAPGLIQLEIGVQTTQTHVLEAICRPCNLPLLKKHVTALLKTGKIHVHLDLIAGLPGETLSQFAGSFNEVFNLGAPLLQLGFLKVLPGTPIAETAREMGYAWQQRAPYEVLQSDKLRFDQLCLLKDIAELLDAYWNNGQMKQVVRYLIRKAPSPFAFFASFAKWFEKRGGFDRSQSCSDRCYLLWQFAAKYNPELHVSTQKGQAFLDLIRFFYLESGQKDQPVWMGFWEQLTREKKAAESGLPASYIQNLIKHAKANRSLFQRTYTQISRWRVDHFTFSIQRFLSDGELVLADEPGLFDLSGLQPKRLHVPE